MLQKVDEARIPIASDTKNISAVMVAADDKWSNVRSVIGRRALNRKFQTRGAHRMAAIGPRDPNLVIRAAPVVRRNRPLIPWMILNMTMFIGRANACTKLNAQVNGLR